MLIFMLIEINLKAEYKSPRYLKHKTEIGPPLSEDVVRAYLKSLGANAYKLVKHPHHKWWGI